MILGDLETTLMGSIGRQGPLSPLSQVWTRPLSETNRQSENGSESLSSRETDETSPSVEDTLFGSTPASKDTAVEENLAVNKYLTYARMSERAHPVECCKYCPTKLFEF